MQPAVLERPREWTELSQLTFEVIAGDYGRPGNQPANHTLVKGRREALLVDVPFGRADAHRLIARILDTGLKLRTIFITRSRPDHVSSLDLLTDVFPDAAVVAHSAVAADIKRLMPLNSDRRTEGIGDNAIRCRSGNDRNAASQKPKRYWFSGLGWPIRNVDRGRDWRKSCWSNE
jgi:glyoxylase-like metal-dependent hydrolase (beta-lactamase superfamily II)